VDYLTLVQKALREAGLRSSEPTTLVDQQDIVADFARWVNEAWRDLQEESVEWFFRKWLNQFDTLLAGVDEYDDFQGTFPVASGGFPTTIDLILPGVFETLDWDTITVYTTAKTDETPLKYMDYEQWRVQRDTVASAAGRPTHITEAPNGKYYVWPVPDRNYYFRFDGVLDVDEMEDDTDTPGLQATLTSATTLPERYHWVLVYDAARKYYEHHGDVDGLAKVNRKYMAQYTRLTEKQRPKVDVPPGVLTGLNSGQWRRK